MVKVLIVDDNAYELQKYQKFVEGLGYEVITAKNFQEATKILMPSDGSPPLLDAILTDTRMGEYSGIDLLQFVSRIGNKDRNNPPPTLLHSSEQSFRFNGGEIDLPSIIPEVFSFAQFHLKADDLTYIKEFFDKIA